MAGQSKRKSSHEKKIHISIRACLSWSACLSSRMFNFSRDSTGFLSFLSAITAFAEDAHLRRARHISTSYRRSLLASSDLAKRQSQAIARCRDLPDGVGKESPRFPARL